MWSYIPEIPQRVECRLSVKWQIKLKHLGDDRFNDLLLVFMTGASDMLKGRDTETKICVQDPKDNKHADPFPNHRAMTTSLCAVILRCFSCGGKQRWGANGWNHWFTAQTQAALSVAVQHASSAKQLLMRAEWNNQPQMPPPSRSHWGCCGCWSQYIWAGVRPTNMFQKKKELKQAHSVDGGK